jgi:hypothetical protein
MNSERMNGQPCIRDLHSANVCRIERKAGKIYFKVNGSTYYTMPSSYTLPLRAGCAFHKLNTLSVPKVQIAGGQ